MTPRPKVTVHAGGLHRIEPVLGVGRYPTGDLILVTHPTPASSPHLTGSCAYRGSTRPNGIEWLPVWAFPRKLQDFITGQPVGTLGKVSNRRVEVVDFATVVPTGQVTVAHGVNVDNWTSW